jgi:hypothetical protein
MSGTNQSTMHVCSHTALVKILMTVVKSWPLAMERLAMKSVLMKREIPDRQMQLSVRHSIRNRSTYYTGES